MDRAINHLEGIREELVRSMRAEAVSRDGVVTVVADAERPYSIRIDTDRAASMEARAIEVVVVLTHNRAHRQLYRQVLHALPAGFSAPRSQEDTE